MMLRYFCVVAPGAAGDMGHAYLQALVATGIRVRALPIGGAAAMNAERRWYELGKLFTTPMAPFVNIVCAPPGLQLGTRTPMTAMGGTRDLVKQEGRTTDVMVFPPELRELLGPQKDASDIVYEPQTALAGLYTVGCKNVAIVYGGAPDAVELEVLGNYDLVIVTDPDAAGFRASKGQISSTALYVPPDATQLAGHLEEICGFGTSATMESSPATDAPPATTWLRSDEWLASSSKSPSSVTPDPSPQSLATATSTSSRFRGIRSWAHRTWRSITRSLVFWRRSRKSLPIDPASGSR
jgi:hypothetical protein